MSFTIDLRKFEGKTEKVMHLVAKKVTFDVGSRVVKRTPVGDPTYWQSPPPVGYVGGRARANWQHALNLNTTTFDKIDKSGAVTIGQILASIPDKAGGKVHYIFNNVPYILRLESGTHSLQAPQGMAAVTVAEFDNIVSSTAKANR